MPTLRLMWLPAAACVASDRSAASRAQLVRALRNRRVRGALCEGLTPSLAAALRAAGLVAASPLAAGAPLAPSVLSLADAGPLLVVVTAGASRAELQRTLRGLAAQRVPTLRLAFSQVPDCHRGSWDGDVAVQVVGGPPAPGVQPRCEGCVRAAACAGPGPQAAVTPLPGAESNQFDLVVRAVLDTPEGAPEAWTGEVPNGELARHLWLMDGGRVLQCVCDNAGWKTAQLAELIDGLGQVWLDRSTKARLDDFAADLGPLAQRVPPAPGAGGHGRPGVWAQATGDPFGTEERALTAVLAPLVGVVVDVGAGPIRYLSLLADRIASRAVRYVAVEPERAALVRTAEALPGAGLARGVGEHLPIRDGVADHVLMLRSFNHLRDVPRAFAEATRVAAPGATLLVVDNVAFGLVRTPEQVAEARAIPVSETPFEHYRNANADAAVDAIEATGAWRVEQVRAVEAGRANQWLVVARRR